MGWWEWLMEWWEWDLVRWLTFGPLPWLTASLAAPCLHHSRQHCLTYFFKDFQCWKLHSLPRKAAHRGQLGHGDRTKASATKQTFLFFFKTWEDSFHLANIWQLLLQHVLSISMFYNLATVEIPRLHQIAWLAIIWGLFRKHIQGLWTFMGIRTSPSSTMQNLLLFQNQEKGVIKALSSFVKVTE